MLKQGRTHIHIAESLPVRWIGVFELILRVAYITAIQVIRYERADV